METQIAQRLEEEYRRRDRQREVDFQHRVGAAAAQAAAKATADRDVELAQLRDHLAEQSEVIRKHQVEELGLRRRARELEARERSAAVEIERQVDARSKAVEEETASRLQEQHRLKDLENEKRISDLRRQLEETTRKLQQGSQQTQGEVAELDLENQLRQAFPQDQFEVFGTGQRGADIVHKVIDARGQVGTIIYEVKNTKAFQEGWIPKLREDQRAKGAEIAVLVSCALPKEIITFATRGGVWVSCFAGCLPLAHVIRWGLIEAARVRVVAENQTEKQLTLLAYCGGTEFRQRVQAMLDPVLAMIEDFERERQALETMWARRKKRHEQIAKAIAGLYGDVGAIIGTLPRIQKLELPAGDDSDGGRAA